MNEAMNNRKALRGLIVKGPLFDSTIDARAAGVLICADHRPIVLPDAMFYEAYLVDLNQRIQQGRASPKALFREEGKGDPVIRDGFAFRDRAELRHYGRIRDRVQRDLRALGYSMGYHFSWGLLTEEIGTNGAIWEVMAGEVLRHFQHHGLTLQMLLDLYEIWVADKHFPPGLHNLSGKLGVTALVADASMITISETRAWIASFLQAEFPAFLTYAGAVATEGPDAVLDILHCTPPPKARPDTQAFLELLRRARTPGALMVG